MKNCIIDKKTLVTRDDLENKLVSGVITEDELKNSTLTDDELVGVLYSALHTLNSLPQSNDNEELNNRKGLIKSILEKRLGRFYPETVINDLSAKFDPRTGSIPVLGKNMNEYFKDSIDLEPFYTFIYDPRANVKNAIKFTDNEQDTIIAYKNKLFSNMSLYLSEIDSDFKINPFFALYLKNGLIQDLNLYTKTMELAWKHIQKGANKLRRGTYTTANLRLFEFIKSFYILNDFDNFVQLNFSNYLKVNQNWKDHISVNSFKYEYTKQTKAFANFNGTDADHDANKDYNKLLNSFIRTINVEGGRPLTLHDFDKIVAYIKNKFNKDDLWAFEHAEDESTIIKLLRDNAKKIGRSLNRNYGELFIISLADALEKNKLALEAREQKLNVNQKATMHNLVNFTKALVLEVTARDVRAYGKETQDDIKIESDANFQQSKLPVRNILLARTLTNIRNGNLYLYNPYWVTALKGVNIFDDSFIKRFEHLTGFNLTAEKVNLLTLLNNDHLLDHILTFLNTFCNKVYLLYATDNLNFEKNLENWLADESLKNNLSWVVFSSFCVSENYVEVQKILDQHKNQRPISTVSALVSNTSSNIKRYTNQTSAYSENVMISRDKLLNFEDTQTPQHIVSRMDISYKNGNREIVLDATKLTPEQNLYVAFNNEFVYSVLTDGVMYNQITCTSNKKNIILGAYNLKKEDKLIKMNLQDLKDVWMKQRRDHYFKLKNQVVNDYVKVFGNMDGFPAERTLENIIQWLENKENLPKNPWGLDTVLSFVHAYNLANPTDRVVFYKELHYTETKRVGGKKPIRFNPYLYANFNDSFYECLYTAGLTDFLNTFKNIQIPSWFKKINDNEQINLVKQLFGITDKEYKELIGRKNWYLGEEDGLGKKIAEKYYLFQNIFKDADLFITTKQNDIQDKGSYTPKLAELQQDINTLEPGNIYHSLLFNTIIAKENSGAKRGNSLNAPDTPMKSCKYGVGDKINIAVVEGILSEVYMYNGEGDKYDANDGVVLTLGIASNWERNSFPGRTFGDTKKMFCAAPSAFTCTLIKCADFVITNDIIRNSFKADDFAGFKPDTTKLPINLKNRVRKMMQQGTFSSSFYNTTEDFVDKVGVFTAKYGNDGKIYSLSSMTVIDPSSHKIKFVWTNVEDSSLSYTNERLVSNVYDIYEELGAENSLDFDNNGPFYKSETSLLFISNLISEYDNSVKSRIISKVADATAFKSGIGNFNLKDVVDSENGYIDYMTIDSDRFGIQNDQSHESDEDTIPSLTQLLSNLSLNGEFTGLAKAMLDTLLDLLTRGLSKLNQPWDGTPAQVRSLTKQLAMNIIRSLKSQVSKASDLQDLAVKVLDNIEANKGLQFLPTSSRSAFRKIASNMIVDLNRRVLRLRFPGTAVINNPSYGLYGIYEDVNGNVYKEEDLINNAIYNGNIELVEKTDFNTAALKTAFKDPKFQKTPISSIEELNLEDTVEVIDKDGTVEIIHIVSPELLYNLYYRENILVSKLYNKKRNLKPPLITWKEDINGVLVTKNLWFIPAVVKRWEAIKTKAPKDVLMELTRWHLECLKSLEKGYYYKTLEDFYSGKKTSIIKGSLVYKSGELIIPKRFKTVLGLGDISMAEVLELQEGFFLGKAKSSIIPVNDYVANPKIDRAVVTLVRAEDELVLVERNEKINPNKFVEYDAAEHKFYYTDEYNNRLFEVPTQNVKVEVSYREGKNVYKIITGTSIKSIIDNTPDVTAYYSDKINDTIKYDNLLKYKNKTVTTLDRTDVNTINKCAEQLASDLFKSFKLYNETISARIPTLAFLSFSVLKTVAFTNTDSNDGYVNAYLNFFQGADFDIDKSYTLMFESRRDGVIETISPLVLTDNLLNYVNGMTILYYPNKKLIVNLQEKTTDENGKVYLQPYSTDEFVKVTKSDIVRLLNLNIDINNLPDSFLEDYLQQLLISGDVNNYYATINRIQEFLEQIIGNKKLISEIDFTSLNRHNYFNISDNGYKNRITCFIQRMTRSMANLNASQIPMTSKPMTDLIDECELETVTYKLNKEKFMYNPCNPLTKWELLFQAKVGNETTGIAANGLKATSALQQFYNEKYEAWDGKTPLDESYIFGKNGKGIHLDLSVKTEAGNRTIIKRDFVRIGDTVFGNNALEKYIKLHELLSDDDILNWKEFGLISSFEKGLLPRMVTPTKIDSGEANLYNAYKVYKKLYNIDITSSRDEFLKFMHFAEQFRMKIADSISIFVSLAVDNMKELALARMHTDSDFMGMAIAMLTLGIEPRDVVDVCINVLDPIFLKRLVNVLLGEQQSEIEPIITEIFGKGPLENKENETSLKLLFNYALDLRILTDFFKVNQGVPATYTTLTSYIRNLSHNKSIQEAKNFLQITNPLAMEDNYYRELIANGIEETEARKISVLMTQDINFKELYTNHTYKNYLEKYYNEFKNGFNVISLITGNPNFSTLIQGLSILVSLISKAAGVAKFVQECLPMFLEKDRLFDADISKILNVYDNFIIGETLKDLNIKFSYNSMGIPNPQTIGKNSVLSLNDEFGIREFMKQVNEYFIPKFKDNIYKSNLFFLYLQPRADKNKNTFYYEIPIDGFNNQDIVSRKLIEDLIRELNSVALNPSGFKTIDGQELNIGELLTLYVMILNNFLLGSALSTCVQAVGNDNNFIIYNKYNDKIVEWDNNLRDKTKTEYLEHLRSLKEIAKAYVNGTDYNGRLVLSAYIYSYMLIPPITLSELLEQGGIDLEGVTLETLNDNNNSKILKLRIKGTTIEVALTLKTNLTSIYDMKLSTEEALNIISVIETNRKMKLWTDGEEDVNNPTLLKLIENSKSRNGKIVAVTLKPFNNVLTVTKPYYLRSDNNGNLTAVLDKVAVESGYFEKNPLILIAIELEGRDKITLTDKAKDLYDVTLDKELVLKYMNYLVDNDQQISLITKISDLLTTLAPQYEDSELYYKDYKGNNKDFLVGDIVLWVGSEQDITYLYLGKIDNKEMFVTPNGVPSISNNPNEFIIKRRLLSPVGITYKPVAISKNTTYGEYTPLTKAKLFYLNYGDKISYLDKVYTVSNTIVENDNVTFVVLLNSSGKFELVSSTNLIFKKAIYATPISNTSNYTNGTRIVVDPDFSETKKYIKQYIAKDNIVTYGDNQLGRVIRVNGNKIQINNNGVTESITLDDITSLTLPPIGSFLADNDTLFNLLVYKSAGLFKFKDPNTQLILANYKRLNVPPEEFLISDVIEDINETNILLDEKDKNNPKEILNVKYYIIIDKTNSKYLIKEYNGKIIRQVGNKNYVGRVINTRIDEGVKLYVEPVNWKPTGNYYSKVYDLIRIDNLKCLSLNNTNGQNTESNVLEPTDINKNVLDYIQNTFGMLILIDPQLSAGDARVEDNIIYMNSIDYKDNFIKYTVHELSHIVLAYIKLKNPDVYYTLILHAKNNPQDGKVIKNIEDELPSSYKGDVRSEEALIRYLETKIDSSNEDIVDVMNLAFAELFNTIKPANDNYSRLITLETFLKSFNNSLIEDFVDELDFDTLKRRLLELNIINNITINCK